MAETCSNLLASCDCTKPAGHVEAGDPAHLCTPECGGSWRGDHPNVVVLRWPTLLLTDQHPQPTTPGLGVLWRSGASNARRPPEPCALLVANAHPRRWP